MKQFLLANINNKHMNSVRTNNTTFDFGLDLPRWDIKTLVYVWGSMCKMLDINYLACCVGEAAQCGGYCRSSQMSQDRVSMLYTLKGGSRAYCW